MGGQPQGCGLSKAMQGAGKGIAGAVAALLLAGAAARAHAEPTLSQNPNALVPGSGSAAPHKSLQLDAAGRWTLKLDMNPPVNDPAGSLRDVSAGAYFHITPSVRIGGSVGLADRQADVQRMLPQDVTGPRVRLETKFKF